jgi:uncharacterized protein (DUF885 family)
VHEPWPGHHVQAALGRTLAHSPALRRLGSNAAYVEGWANYAERLAEESGINTGDSSIIQRRVILGCGFVLDAGIHGFG